MKTTIILLFATLLLASCGSEQRLPPNAPSQEDSIHQLIDTINDYDTDSIPDKVSGE